MTNAPMFRRTPVAAAVFAALHAAAGHAQTGSVQPTQLPRISVSGEGEDTNTYKPERAQSPKFTEPLLDTPQTVLVIRKEVFTQQGALSLTDTLRNTPGITFQLGENGNTQSGDTLFMRGFDAQNAIFVDGIRDLGAAVRDVFNVEQVEIFKGPAGADNGRGATSGYVNLASKVPGLTDAFSGSLAYGTEERRRLTTDWNHALDSVGGAAFRLNLVGQDGGVAGRDFIERESWGVAPSFALGLGTDTRFYAYSQHVRQDNVPDGAVPTIGIADYRNAALDDAGIVAPRVDDEGYYGLASDYEDIEADMFTLRFEHDFSEDVTLRNTARYGRSEQERVLTAPLRAPIVSDDVGGTTVVRTDPATWQLNRTRHASFRENEIVTNQTNVTASFATGGIQHSLSTGVEIIHESQFSPTYTSVSLPPTSLYNPDRSLELSPVAPNGAYSDGRTTTGALYAFDTWKLTPRWQLSTGLRWEHYRTETRGVQIQGNNPPVNVSLEDSDDALSYKIGVLFKPADEGSVYVAFANSIKPPGADNFALNATATNVNNPNLDPQKATHVELGTKWDLLDRRLAVTGALFRSRNKNDLARTDPSNPDAVIQYGEREVEGLELGVVGQITPAWQISAGLTRQNTEVLEGRVSADGSPSTQTGANINFSPKFSATLWTSYRLPYRITVGGGVRHQSTQARSVSNVPASTGVFEVPSYTVVDLFAAYDVTDNVGLQLNAYNVGDEDYVAAINNSGERYLPGIPRSWLLTVNFRL
ncbi:MAG: catecholate siderophore receptor Fiu [Steroidobacteraceae bacterium]|nr:catecholate siderophore receptor Fiu [Steroidobacteraceae bacterium]